MKIRVSYIALVCLFFSCGQNTDFEPQENVVLHVPSNLGDMPSQNFKISKEGIALGKQLFFDPELSSNGKVSCATCHKQGLAFSDGLDLGNTGVSEKRLERNSPPLFNLAWHKGYFWDGGSTNLESQVFAPLTHADEMSNDLSTILQYINSNEDYIKQFDVVFNKRPVTSQMLAYAIAQYEISLISANSKYDRVIRNEGDLLTEQEKNGLKLFTENCGSCHATDHFTTYGYANNGLDSVFDYPFEDPRLGRARITNSDKDLGKYKIPSLRNIALTAPYMHDGRFSSLEEVLLHYSSEIKMSSTLSSQLPQGGFALTKNEMDNIIAFLQTLTDYQFITASKHAL